MTAPTFHSVQSSNIDALAHHEGNLHVRFKDGSVWSYSGVPASTLDEMRSSPSVGKFFHANIKGKYQGSKV